METESQLYRTPSRSMPQRSPTCTAAELDHLANDPNVQRIAGLLNDFERTLKSSVKNTASILQDPEVLPIPNFMVQNSYYPTVMIT